MEEAAEYQNQTGPSMLLLMESGNVVQINTKGKTSSLVGRSVDSLVRRCYFQITCGAPFYILLLFSMRGRQKTLEKLLFLKIPGDNQFLLFLTMILNIEEEAN